MVITFSTYHINTSINPMLKQLTISAAFVLLLVACGLLTIGASSFNIESTNYNLDRLRSVFKIFFPMLIRSEELNNANSGLFFRNTLDWRFSIIQIHHGKSGLSFTSFPYLKNKLNNSELLVCVTLKN